MKLRKKKFVELNTLKGIIREKGSTYRKLAMKTTMEEPTFSNKMNGFSSFTAAEMDILIEELDIRCDDIGYVFFPHRQTKTRRVL